VSKAVMSLTKSGTVVVAKMKSYPWWPAIVYFLYFFNLSYFYFPISILCEKKKKKNVDEINLLFIDF